MAKSDILVHLNLNGNEIQNVVAQNLAAVPTTNVTAGRFYFNSTDNTLYVYNGTAWMNALGQGSTYTFSTGLTETSGTVTLNAATTSALGGVIVGSNISVNSGIISVADASTSAKGVIEIATDSEATTGTSETLAINPKQLATAVSGLIKLTNLSIASGSSNYLGYDNTTGQFSAKVDTTVGTVSTNLVTSGAVNTALGNKLDKKPDGTNDLINSGNKINLTYIPDVLTGQMLYAGTVVPSTAVATLSTNAKTKLGTTSDTITLTNDTTAITGYAANEGNYYICSADGTFAGVSLLTGDWLLSTGSGWTKIDNTDAVTGVKGNAESTYRTGNVNITADNVMPTQTGNSGKYLTTDGTNVSWGTVDALPSQSGQSGKFLTTNGTSASWAEVMTASSTNTLTNKTIDADDNTISDLTTSNFKSGTITTSVSGSSTDTQIPTALAVWNTLSERAYIATRAGLRTWDNPSLTASGGEATWQITTTSGMTAAPQVFVYKSSNNEQVFPKIGINSSGNITATFNTTSNIAANTYYASVMF